MSFPPTRQRGWERVVGVRCNHERGNSSVFGVRRRKTVVAEGSNGFVTQPGRRKKECHGLGPAGLSLEARELGCEPGKEAATSAPHRALWGSRLELSRG